MRVLFRHADRFPQTARSLLKALLAVKAGKKVAGNAAYLNDVSQSKLHGRCAVRSQSDWMNPAQQIAAFRCASLQGIEHVAVRMPQPVH
jgi:hypothetical protein